VVQVADAFRVGGAVRSAVLVGEDGDEAAIAGVEIEMVF
jgi:hypothetical protein